MLDSVVQWILPPIPCTGYLLDIRIQKSRQPFTDNVRGVYDAGALYTKNDVVYYGSPIQSYPGWRWKNNTPGNSTPALGADWEYASNFEFTQADDTTVFYLDQQLISDDGLGDIQRHVSRQEGKLTPDIRELSLLDYEIYSGEYGDGTPESGDLSGSIYRTLNARIFDDPDALYTVFCSKVNGSDRELSFIGDIDYTKATQDYVLDLQPGTDDALQHLLIKVQAEGWANRLNTFTVRDLISTITLNDMNGTRIPFIGNYVNVGCANGAITQNYIQPNWGETGGREDMQWVFGRFKYSRTHTRATFGSPFSNTFFFRAIMPASTSCNDELCFLLLPTLLLKMAELANATFSNLNIGTNMSFWSDVTAPNSDPKPGIISSTGVGVTSVGFAYHYLFNVDPRCDLNVAEYDMGGFGWDTPLSEVLTYICKALLTYTQGTYDQTNKRGELNLVDSLAPSGTPLPSNWTPTIGAGAKPRLVSANHVRVQNRGDSDIIACPNSRGTSLSVEIGPRVKRMGLIDTDRIQPSVDLIYNGHLTQIEQWRCWAPYYGGIGEGGHVRMNAGTVGGGPGIWTLQDNDTEFVLIQGAVEQRFYVKNDVYNNPTTYLSVDTPSGHADPIMFANGCYGVINYKSDRHNVTFAVEPTQGGVTGSVNPPTGTGVHYRIGYTEYREDLEVFDGSRFVRSATTDWTNYDSCGNLVLGQQIVIPARGVYKCVGTGLDSLGNPDVNWMELDRAIEGDGTNLESLVGGPTPSPNAMIGRYLYYVNSGFGAHLRFSNFAYQDDSDGGTSGLPRDFLPAFWLNKYQTFAEGNYYGCYALSRMRYVDGSEYDGLTAPNDTYGNSLKTTAQCHAALNLGSYSTVTRPFDGSLDDSGSLTGYNPQDIYTEYAQGESRTYRATGLMINERGGGVTGELLEETGKPPLNDKNFPIRIVGAGSSGSSGSSSGSLGGSSSGGGNPSGGTTNNLIFGSGSVTTNVNDWNLPLLADVIYISSTNAATVSGITAFGMKQRIILINVGTFVITLQNENTNSAAVNRFHLQGTVNKNIPMGPDAAVELVYDSTDHGAGVFNRWRVTALR